MSTDQPHTGLDPDNFIHCPGCGLTLDVSGFQPLDPLICPECQHESVVPADIEQYRLKRLLGEGAMGRVYLAEDLNLQREVAIKILRKNLAETPRMWTMLEKEARAAAGIHHAHVVQIYSMGKTRGRPYIIMELVPNVNLETRMKSVPLTEKETFTLGIEIMEGLKAATAKGLLHGDIKPANIILTLKGKAKVADFGLSRLIGREKTVERWGTPYYIAPEKSIQQQEDFRSDQYSLGATLFHCMAGQAPFEGETGEEVIQKSLTQPTPWLPDRCVGVSDACGDILYRMMQRDPEKRFPSYDSAIAAMRLALRGKYHPGKWEGARRMKSNTLLARLKLAWRGEDAAEDDPTELGASGPP
jgi:serine/threonine protein kinase